MSGGEDFDPGVTVDDDNYRPGGEPMTDSQRIGDLSHLTVPKLSDFSSPEKLDPFWRNLTGAAIFSVLAGTLIWFGDIDLPIIIAGGVMVARDLVEVVVYCADPVYYDQRFGDDQ